MAAEIHATSPSRGGCSTERSPAMTADVITLKPEPAVLDRLFTGEPARHVLSYVLRDFAPGKTAVVSSFGAESAVLLHLVASVDRATPVIFIDTLKHFPETLEHRDRLIARLGLTDVRSIRPTPERVDGLDPAGDLHSLDSDACCAFRKTEPLARALEGFDAWISGRKRHQAATRTRLPLFEREDGRIKVNPLAAWGPDELRDYMATHDLPAHPLVARGFPSIGCAPCTSAVAEHEDARAGRWRGTGKTECGIHLSLNGQFARTLERAGAGC